MATAPLTANLEALAKARVMAQRPAPAPPAAPSEAEIRAARATLDALNALCAKVGAQ